MLGEYISQYRNKNTFYIYYTTNTNAPKRKYLIIYKICMTPAREEKFMLKFLHF